MVRSGQLSDASCRRFPHARGDGPLRAEPMAAIVWVFPTAWGWSAAWHRNRKLIPGFPHPRGDGPQLGIETSGMPCSPHPRGDGPSTGQHRFEADASSPHPRGDGPARACCCRRRGRLSPPAWGWSEPAHASGLGRARSPHPRGDGPWERTKRLHARLFSAPAWGSSATRPTMGWAEWPRRSSRKLVQWIRSVRWLSKLVGLTGPHTAQNAHGGLPSSPDTSSPASCHESRAGSRHCAPPRPW